MARVCAEPGCHLLAEGRASRCGRHDPLTARNHRGVPRQARGYGREYGAERSRLIGQPCSLRLPGCTGTADTAQHVDGGGLAPACAHCNYADGADRSRRATGGRVGSLGDDGPTRTDRQSVV